MEKKKSIKLACSWSIHDGRERTQRNHDTQCEFFAALDFVTWLYENGFAIGTKFQGEDLEKQEELFK